MSEKHNCELENCSCTVPLFTTCDCCEQGHCDCKNCDLCTNEDDTLDPEEK